MLEPQSTTLFVLLIVMFGALVWRIMAGRLVVLRMLAACLAFVTAMAFGVLAVNRYYDYYQTWGAMMADLTHQGVDAASGVPEVKLESGVQSGTPSGTLDGSRGDLELAQRQGYLLRLTVTGQRSRITRLVYVYLPAQSRDKARKTALEHIVKTFFDGSMEHAVAALLDISGVDVKTDGLDRVAQMVQEARKDGK